MLLHSIRLITSFFIKHFPCPSPHPQHTHFITVTVLTQFVKQINTAHNITMIAYTKEAISNFILEEMKDFLLGSETKKSNN